MLSLRLRTLTAEERSEIERLSRSRTASARQVERARILAKASEGHSVAAIAKSLAVSAKTVRLWIQRFHHEGLPGLSDRPRSGAPLTYTPLVRSEVIVTALTNPQELDLPFACWTLDRLQAYLNEEKGIGIKRSRIDDLLIAEGLRWRAQETFFSEKAALEPNPTKEDRPLDAAFAEKRGPSKPCIRPLRPTAR